MIWQFLQFVRNSAIFRRLAWAALAVLAAVGLVARERRDAAKDALEKRDAKDAREEVEALQRGANGAAEGKAKLRDGKTPQQIKDGNDAKWD